MRRRPLPALVPALLMAAACSGGSKSGPAAPSPTTTTTTTTTTVPSAPTTATVGPLTFTFETGTTASDATLMQEAARIALDFFPSAFGRTVQQPTAITASATAQGCSAGGSAAFTGSRTMTICFANPGWTMLGPIMRRKVVVHEVFHLLQFEMRWLGNPATAGAQWIIEGAAEDVGFRGIANAGLLAFDIARGCAVKETSDFNARQPPGLPNLNALETPQSFNQTVGPLYPHSMIGIDALLAVRGVSALMTYGDAIAGGAAFPAAFQTAFGTTTTVFYDQFPAFRASLPVPAVYQCGV